MPRYILSRLALAVVMALLATLVIFLIANTVPGDPVLAQLGDLAASNKEFVAAWRAKWGLDLPLWERYLIFLQRLLHGDLGISIASQRPVLARHRRLRAGDASSSPRIAFLLSIVVGMPLGILAAVRRDSWIDHVARFISLIGVSSPTFWLAFIVLARLLRRAADRAGSRPPRRDRASAADGHRPLPDRQRARRRLGDVQRRARASGPAVDRAGGGDARPHHAHDARQHAGELQQDYVRVARAKGMQERASSSATSLPNALIPVVTLGGLAYANLLTGAVMTETIFSWPGLGRYTFRSAVALDFPAIMGITLVVAIIYLIINLLVDISYALLDPRVVR